jgi:hypothetical protein
MRPLSSNEMLRGWRIIGSQATTLAAKPGGSCIRLTASSGEKPWATTGVVLASAIRKERRMPGPGERAG